jgi:hypothetical protein
MYTVYALDKNGKRDTELGLFDASEIAQQDHIVAAQMFGARIKSWINFEVKYPVDYSGGFEFVIED